MFSYRVSECICLCVCLAVNGQKTTDNPVCDKHWFNVRTLILNSTHYKPAINVVTFLTKVNIPGFSVQDTWGMLNTSLYHFHAISNNRHSKVSRGGDNAPISLPFA